MSILKKDGERIGTLKSSISGWGLKQMEQMEQMVVSSIEKSQCTLLNIKSESKFLQDTVSFKIKGKEADLYYFQKILNQSMDEFNKEDVKEQAIEKPKKKGFFGLGK